MKEFLTQTYYGNTIADWGICLLIIIGSVVIAKILYWIINKFIKQITKNSKNKFDDIVVDMLEEPVVFSLIILGIWYALRTLELTPEVQTIIEKGYYILIIFNVTWLVVRLLDAIIEEYIVPLVEKSDTDLDDQLLPILRKSIKISLWVLALILALNNAGYNVGALLAGVGIGGLALAMAAHDTVSNIFGGVTVFTDKPFKIKDRIVINGVDGVVENIGVRSTRVRTLAGRIVTIPNSTFTSGIIENVSSEPSRKVVLTIGLAYNTSYEKMQLALETLKDINAKNVHTEEAILLSFDAFKEFALNITFVFYVKKSADIPTTQTEISLEILRQFNAKGLEFGLPTYNDLYLGKNN